jgi:flagellar motor switch protein FliN/FliY
LSETEHTQEEMVDEAALEAAMDAAMLNEAEAANGAVDARPPEFGDLGPGPQMGDPAALSLVYDLTVPVAIELGRTRMSVQEVLALGRGSVIQLDRLAGEPIDVFVGDRRFAEGEVVVVGEQFGVRITRIIQNPQQKPTQGEPS